MLSMLSPIAIDTLANSYWSYWCYQWITFPQKNFLKTFSPPKKKPRDNSKNIPKKSPSPTTTTKSPPPSTPPKTNKQKHSTEKKNPSPNSPLLYKKQSYLENPPTQKKNDSTITSLALGESIESYPTIGTNGHGREVSILSYTICESIDSYRRSL